MANQNNKDYGWFWIAIIIVAVIVIYLLTFGNFNPENFQSRYDELKESLEKAKNRNKKLQVLIEKKTQLKKKLAKRFKRIYFTVRVILVMLWFALLFACYTSGLITNLGDALNISESMLLVLVLLNFITFGTLTNLDKFLESIKTRVENRVYGKYLTIEEKLEMDKMLKLETENEINALKHELSQEEQRNKLEEYPIQGKTESN